jgi:hypothetical protein
MEDDDNSDEDIGKHIGLTYDSDDKNDEEVIDSGEGNELIDLGSGSQSTATQRKAAAKIPKLSGPN